MSEFAAFLTNRIASQQTSTEDALASFLPLARQVVEAHRRGMVAPLDGLDALQVEGVVIWFEEAKLAPERSQRRKIEKFVGPQTRSVDIVSETKRTTEIGEGISEVRDLAVAQAGDEVTRPVYVPGYKSWEHELGHHDPLTDVFSLGLILASLSCFFDFREFEDLHLFAECRQNLFLRNPHLHPVLAKAILRMTDLRRHRRAQDLEAVVHNLENYRSQEVDFELDLSRDTTFGARKVPDKRHVILDKLQERLFEFTRRNRLLHFRQTGQSVNLTHASVPLLFDMRSVRADQILTWGGKFESDILKGKPVNLHKYLNFSEALYLPSLLDRIRVESRRDQAEFGSAQLRIVACFLRWYNLKEKTQERFDSPFLLIPVTLTKKKGIRDSYWVEPLGTEAEVNPVLRHYLKQLFDMDLPETIDLEETSIDAVYAALQQSIQSSEPGIELIKVDQPRIDLIHDRARRRLDQYQRLRIGGRSLRGFADIDYSYSLENLQPLGLRLFEQRIRRPLTHLREIVQEHPTPRQFAVADSSGAVAEKEKTFYSIREKGDDNPYHWELDLTSVTLGNFRYRKMSLVRDYLALRDQELESPAFDAVFSLQPKALDAEGETEIPVRERFHVVPADPTQTSAIGLARSGRSYIIQGPPGTGKSQTITNLIADFVARGKRVLFVCEKRAAIDVVYHRLRQRQLDSLCTLIHDALADKKEFVMDLKRSYEGLQKHGAKGNWEGRRSALQTQLDNELRPLQRFHDAMTNTPASVGVPVQTLIHRSVALSHERPDLSVSEQESLPSFAEWHEHRERIEQLAVTVAEIQNDGVLAHHPLKDLRSGIAREERPAQFVSAKLREADELFESLDSLADETQLDLESATLGALRELGAHATRLRELAGLNLLELLERQSDTSLQFDTDVDALKTLRSDLHEAQEQAQHWRKRIPRQELATARERAKILETKTLAFLSPTWWQLRKVLQRHYDFRAHSITPSWLQVLEKLEEAYAAKEAHATARGSMEKRYRLSADIETFAAGLETLRDDSARMSGNAASFHQALVNNEVDENGIVLLARLAETDSIIDRLASTLTAVVETAGDDASSIPVAKFRRKLETIDSALDTLPDFLYCLSELERLPSTSASALRTFPITTRQIEAGVSTKAIEDIYREDRAVSRFDDTVRRRHVAKMEKLDEELQSVNAAVVRERVSRRFLERLKLAARPASQLDKDQKAFKEDYTRGRRELEHEFGKVMRFKSIRDLVSGSSGIVVRDLKPVWLMSPLSVSDTLPLDGEGFDVVIFDEASQVTLEEAVPSLARAPQVIVVGDEMQLPPTNFFSAKRPDDEESLLVEEDGEIYEYDLESNSFLNHAGRNLPSKMLGWHYRSRSESLISFSNWAFYQGQLLTVPERGRGAVIWGALRAESAEDGAANLDRLLERPVSFHFMSHGIYEKRRNRSEAEYIAEMVRALLLRDDLDPRPSVGVVAFSEAQQDEIEQALERLARGDRAFRLRLEAEREREVEDQFAGLLVKNLENIQGDERDIIIMSVCYGYDQNGRMLMNFGPINQNGGERRLNVAFSRAKGHMAVVSSIRDVDIKNDYNDGANCLKRYLGYADASSAARSEATEQILSSMVLVDEESRGRDQAAPAPLLDQLEAAIQSRGFSTARGLGQSHFRCDLAVRQRDDDPFCLAIFIDHDHYYGQSDILERDLLRPKLLRAFGWRVAHVLVKDWYEDRERVLDYLEKQLTSEQEPVEDVEVDLDSEALGVPDARLPEEADRGEPHIPVLDLEPAWAAYFERRTRAGSSYWEIAAAGHQYRTREIGSATVDEYRVRSFSSASAMEEQATRAMAQHLALGYTWTKQPVSIPSASSRPDEVPEPEDAADEELPPVLRTSNKDLGVDRRRLPPMWNAATLPRPILAASGRSLPLPALEKLGKLLSGTTIEEPQPGLEGLREVLLPESLESFATALFRQWLDVGAPMRHKWPLIGFGQLCGEATARHLAPHILEWPHEGGAARAALGLKVLEQAGGDVALMYGQWVAEWARTKGLKKNVSEMMVRIAESRGIKKSRAKDLRDVAPTLGLDADGRSSSFELSFDGQLRFVEGVPVTSEAKQRLCSLREDVCTLLAIHRLRLERAMCTRHQWTAASLRERLWRHPIVRLLTRGLVWQLVSDGTAFRVTDEETCEDENVREVEVAGQAKVQIPHALELDGKLLERWRSRFDEVGTNQPFDQLHRSVFERTSAESNSFRTERFKGTQTSFARLLKLAALGWRPERDYNRLGGFGEPICKRVGQTRWHVYLDIDKNGVLGDAKLVEGNSWTEMVEVTFGQLDPLQFSEVMRELEQAKA